MICDAIVTDQNGVPYEHNGADVCPAEKVLAKTGPIGGERPRKCWVLCGVDGHLFNPLAGDIYGRKRDGHDVFSLKRCCSKCYLSYTEFLRSKNHTHFILASREFISGGYI